MLQTKEHPLIVSEEENIKNRYYNEISEAVTVESNTNLHQESHIYMV